MRCASFLGLLTAASAVAAEFTPSAEVPLIGPSFLSNFDPTDSQYIRNASESFPAAIDAFFESGALNKSDVELTFSVDVFSAATNKSLYSYQYIGEVGKLGLTTGEMNDETIGRTGSVSKLFTAYAIIAKAGIEVFSHPVTRYIPELLGNSSGDPLSHVRWEDITVGALASHQAGSGGIATFIEEKLGDATSAEDVPDVTPQELFSYMRDSKRPTSSPYRNALYSDAGYCILGQVLARLSGQSYFDALRDTLLKPLGMNGTSVSAPQGPDVNANNRSAIPAGTTWGFDVPITEGSGGVYSNHADLRALGLSILNSEILSAATTSHWMKPLSGTGSLVEVVGAPWEISRLAIPVTPGSNRTRVSDLYTKAGGNGDYTCVFGLSPDHGIGFSIMVGGVSASEARWPIRNAVGELFVPAAEAAAAESAEENLAGVFEASEGNNITLSVDDGQPGLGLPSMFLDGVQVIAPAPTSRRLYPMGLYSDSRSLSALYNTEGRFRTSFREVITALVPRSTAEGGAGGLFDDQHSWMDVGFRDAGDEWVFTIDDGRLISVESVAVQLTFNRVE